MVFRSFKTTIKNFQFIFLNSREKILTKQYIFTYMCIINENYLFDCEKKFIFFLFLKKTTMIPEENEIKVEIVYLYT